jgi:non-homologous end joining protein Ku
MRTIRKGYLKCSLVTIPVKKCTATTKRPPQFHLCHKACGSRINQKMSAPSAGELFPGRIFGPRPSKGASSEKAL